MPLNDPLKPTPETSHTQGLIDISQAIMEKNGIRVDVLRPVNHKLAYGVYTDMTAHGNEDGAKHCAMNILYSLQHLGFVIPPQANAAWLGGVGPGPSYLDPGSGGTSSSPVSR